MPLYAVMGVNETLEISALIKDLGLAALENVPPAHGNADCGRAKGDSPPRNDDTKWRRSYVLSACSRSAIKSSLSSMPIDSRTTSGAAPDLILAASSSWLWVVEAG
jgi:hypothetical protein